MFRFRKYLDFEIVQISKNIQILEIVQILKMFSFLKYSDLKTVQITKVYISKLFRFENVQF
jgi:hypothetical protein